MNIINFLAQLGLAFIGFYSCLIVIGVVFAIFQDDNDDSFHD